MRQIDKQIKERPILMSGPMVQAVLADRKTMTRRVVRPQPDSRFTEFTHTNDKSWWFGWEDCFLDDGFRCPYGKVGDRLWVREGGWVCENRFFAYSATPGTCKQGDIAPPDNIICSDSENYGTPDVFRQNGWKQVPSIFMPRWASRLTLEITDVRVERAQSITEEDAAAEGLIPHGKGSARGWQTTPAGLGLAA